MGICHTKNKNEQIVTNKAENSRSGITVPSNCNQETNVKVKKECVNNKIDVENQIKEINALLTGNTDKFYDSEFLPKIESLLPDNPHHKIYGKVSKEILEKIEKLEWKPINEIYNENKMKIFQPKLTCDDIHQGILSNCYFLSAVSALILHDVERLRRLLIINNKNSRSLYAVKLFKQGEEIIITVDDFIPTKTSEINGKFIPAFSYSRPEEMCILLLEKAWAKLNNQCYLKTCLGTPQEAISALCEAPCVMEYHKKFENKNNLDILWEILCEAQENKWITCSSTEKIENNEIGLYSFHAYSVTGLYEIPISKKNSSKNDFKRTESKFSQIALQRKATKDYSDFLRLIKLRNSNGDNSKFKGQFYENSKNWTKEIRKAVGTNLNPAIVILTFEEFCKYFSFTFICKYEMDFTYNYTKFKMQCESVKSNMIEDEFNDHLNANTNIVNTKYNEDDNHELKKLDNCFIYNNKKIEIQAKTIDDQSIDLLSDEGQTNLPINTNNKNISLNHIKKLNINLEKISNKEVKFLNSPQTQTERNKSNSSFNFVESNINENIENSNLMTIKSGKSKRTSRKKQDFNCEQPHAIQLDTIIKEMLKMEDVITSCIVIEEPTKCYITLHQPQIRFHEEIEDNISLAFIILAKYDLNKKSYTYENSEFINWEKITLEHNFSTGEYHIFAKSFWCHTKNYNLVLSTYAESPVKLYNLEKDDYPSNWLELIMIDVAKKCGKDYFSREEITSFSSKLDLEKKSFFTGFYVFYYENNSSNASIVVKLNFKKIEGIIFMNIEKTDSLFFIIPPKKRATILWQITDFPWICRMDYSEELWIEYPTQYLVKMYFNPDKSHKEIIQEGLVLYEVPYLRGFILIIDNLTRNFFKGEIFFSDLKDYEIENFSGLNTIQFKLEPKNQKYINVKGTKKQLDSLFKLNYQHKFFKI